MRRRDWTMALASGLLILNLLLSVIAASHSLGVTKEVGQHMR